MHALLRLGSPPNRPAPPQPRECKPYPYTPLHHHHPSISSGQLLPTHLCSAHCFAQRTYIHTTLPQNTHSHTHRPLSGPPCCLSKGRNPVRQSSPAPPPTPAQRKGAGSPEKGPSSGPKQSVVCTTAQLMSGAPFSSPPGLSWQSGQTALGRLESAQSSVPPCSPHPTLSFEARERAPSPSLVPCSSSICFHPGQPRTKL